MALKVRGAIPHPKYSPEWIDEYLDRRYLTREAFMQLSEKKTQKDIAKDYHMQKTDVGVILKTLGVDTHAQKKRKVAEGVIDFFHEKRNEEKELIADIFDELSHTYSTYGGQRAKEIWGEEAVRILNKCFPEVAGPHASVIRSHKAQEKFRGSIEAIEALMKEKKSPASIAKELGLREDRTRKYIMSVAPDYAWELTSDQKETIRQANRKIRDEKRVKRLQKKWEALSARPSSFYEDLIFTELLSFEALQLKLKADEEILLNFYKQKVNVDLEAIFSGEAMLHGPRMRYFAANNLFEDFEPQAEVQPLLEAVGVPERFKRYPNLFRMLVVSEDADILKTFITDHRITDGYTLFKLFPFQSYSNYASILSNLLSRDVFYSKDLCEKVQESSQVLKTMSAEEVKLFLEKQIVASKSTVELASKLDLKVSQTRLLLAFFGLRTKYKFSLPEAELSFFFEEDLGLTPDFHRRDVLNDGSEVDFYFEDLKVAIEVNPTHTHNATIGFLKKFAPRDENYHQKKSKSAEAAGVRLLHLYDVDLHKSNFQSRTIPWLKHKLLGPERVFYARATKVRRLSKRSEITKARSFVEAHHLQGNVSAKEYYVMEAKETGELLGVASFSPYRGQAASWELKRLVFLPEVQVRYGLSKFISHFKANHSSVDKLYSYSNSDYSDGSCYQAAGFDFLHWTKPSIRWENPTDATDSYSWSVATSWSAKSGILARAIGSRRVTNSEAEELVVHELPHRGDSHKGYVKVATAGSKLWLKELK